MISALYGVAEIAVDGIGAAPNNVDTAVNQEIKNRCMTHPSFRPNRVCIFFLCIFSMIEAEEAKKSPIQTEDQTVLESFFKILLTKETLGYVLLGEKPIAFFSYIPELSWKHPIQSVLRLKTYLSSENQSLINGWETWEK